MNTLKIDNDILINTCSNFEKDFKEILFSTDINFIQFHFCLEGKISLRYNNGAYTFNLQENNQISFNSILGENSHFRTRIIQKWPRKSANHLKMNPKT